MMIYMMLWWQRFVSAGKAYITVALMIFFKMESIDDYPTAHCFENNMIHKACETRKQFFDDKIGEFVDNYIFQSNQRPPPVVWKKILWKIMHSASVIFLYFSCN